MIIKEIPQDSNSEIGFIKRYELSRKLGYGRLHSFVLSLQTCNKNLEKVTQFFIQKAHQLTYLDHTNFLINHHFRGQDEISFSERLKEVFFPVRSYSVDSQQQLVGLGKLAHKEFSLLKYDGTNKKFLLEESTTQDDKIAMLRSMNIRNNPYMGTQYFADPELKQEIVVKIDALFNSTVVQEDIIKRRNAIIEYLGGQVASQ